MFLQLDLDFDCLVELQVKSKQISLLQGNSLKTAFSNKWPGIADKIVQKLSLKCSNRDLKTFLAANSEKVKEGKLFFYTS